MNHSKNSLDSQFFWPPYGLSPLRIESYESCEPAAEPLFSLIDGDDPEALLVETVFGDPEVDDPAKRSNLARTAAALFASAMDMFELLRTVQTLRITNWGMAPLDFDQWLSDVSKVMKSIVNA